MRARLGAMSLAILCSAAPLQASPQEPPGVPATSLESVRERLDGPPARRFAPSIPVPLRPTFRSKTDEHPFVLTFDEYLHKTFDLNELQRQSADWSARCCGIDLVRVFKGVDKALDEQRTRKIREEIRRELAELVAARAAAGVK